MTSGRPSQLSCTARQESTFARIAVSGSVLASASACAMTASSSVLRPSGHRAQLSSAQWAGTQSRIAAGLAEHLINPVRHVREAVSVQEVLAERRAQLERWIGGVLADRPFQGGAEVVEFAVEGGEVLLRLVPRIA